MSNSRVSSLPPVPSPLNVRAAVLPVFFDLADFRVEHDLDALFLENAAERFRNLEVGAGEDLRQRFDDEHVCAHARVYGREL